MTFLSKIILPFSLLLIFFMACNNPSPEPEVDPDQANEQIDSTKIVADSLVSEDEEPEVDRLNAKDLSAKNSLPVELDYARDEEEMKEAEIPDVVVRFFPLGWSLKGDLAFLEYSITYHEGHLLEYKIYKREEDTINLLKSTVFSILPEDAEFPWEASPDVIIQSEEEFSQTKALELFWAAGEDEIMALLKKYEIEYDPRSNFNETTSYEGLEFSIRTKEAEMENSYYLSNGKKEKLIAQGIDPEIKNISFMGVLEDSKKEHYLLLALKRGQFFEMTDELSLLLSKTP